MLRNRFQGAILAGVVLAGAAVAQITSNPVDLPDGPAAPGFDIKRFSNAGNGAFETFYVQKTEGLKDVLDQGRVAAATRVLVFSTAGGKLALIQDQMAFHHIAQGTDGGKDWMATFWVVCNSGTSLVPTINRKTHHFNNVGLYDALFVMQDTESKTLWRHIDGQALYGPMVGRTLGPVGNLLQMSVQQALAADPKTRIAVSDRPYTAGGRQFGGRGGVPGGGRGGSPAENAQLMGMFAETLGQEDTRRPRMELGLGIWTAETRRYYPVSAIRERGRAFIDQIDGKSVLIYIDPETNNPAALFVNSETAKMEGEEVRLDNGSIVRSGVLLDQRGRTQSADRPQQIFTRWYGFALTFPGPEIFGQY